MSQQVQLQDRVMQRMKIKVSGQNAGTGVVCRMLDRRKISGLKLAWYNHHATGMLSGGSLDSGTAGRQPQLL